MCSLLYIPSVYIFGYSCLMRGFSDLLVMYAENCPDHDPSLSGWNPGHQPEKAVIIKRGHLFRLEASATFHSLTIQSGGKHTSVHDVLRSILSCNIGGLMFIKYDK